MTMDWVLRQHTCILHGSGGWESKIKVLNDLVPGEGSFFLFCILTCQGERKRARGNQPTGASFIRYQSHSWGLHPYDLITSQRPQLLIPSHWGLRFQHRNLRGVDIAFGLYTPMLANDGSVLYFCKIIGFILSLLKEPTCQQIQPHHQHRSWIRPLSQHLLLPQGPISSLCPILLS